MNATVNPNAIPLDPRVTVTATRKRFTHGYTYQAPITTFMGSVSGGGTRSGTAVKTGYNLRITNNENVMRSYYFSVGIFSDHANKVVRETIPRHIAHVHPGHTMEVDIELPQPADFANCYLIDFVISEGSQYAVAHFTPDYPLALAAEPNGPLGADDIADIFTFVTGCEMIVVSLIIGSMLSYHYHYSGWVGWGAGITSFVIGLKLLERPFARAILCTLFSLIWGLMTFSKFGLLEAVGVTLSALIIHWWLRSPARAAQRKLLASRRDLAK